MVLLEIAPFSVPTIPSLALIRSYAIRAILAQEPKRALTLSLRLGALSLLRLLFLPLHIWRGNAAGCAHANT